MLHGNKTLAPVFLRKTTCLLGPLCCESLESMSRDQSTDLLSKHPPGVSVAQRQSFPANGGKSHDTEPLPPKSTTEGML